MSMRDGGSTMLDTASKIHEYIYGNPWRKSENANTSYSYSGMVGHVANFVTSDYALSKIYPEEIAKAHRETRIHLHDLSGLCNYCSAGG